MTAGSECCSAWVEFDPGQGCICHPPRWRCVGCGAVCSPPKSWKLTDLDLLSRTVTQ